MKLASGSPLGCFLLCQFLFNDLGRFPEYSSFEEDVGSDFHVGSLPRAFSQEAEANNEKHCHEGREKGLPRVTVKPITDRADHYPKLRSIWWNPNPQE